jgi:hypothetical protein
MADSNPYATNYNYSSPNINASSVGGQTVNGQSNVGGYQMPDYTSIANGQNKNSQNFNNAQYGTIGAFQGANQAAVNALPTYQKLQNDANTQYNVQPLAQKANDLNNTVLQIPQTYSQATQGSDTNNNQLMQLIGQKQWELDPLAQASTNSAQTAQGLANTMVQAGVNNEQQQLSPFANSAGLVNSAISGGYANFTADQANQLAALEAAVASGATLSGQDAATLASLQNAKTQADALIAAQKISSQNQILASGSTYYNPTTGGYYNPTTKVSAPA